MHGVPGIFKKKLFDDKSAIERLSLNNSESAIKLMPNS